MILIFLTPGLFYYYHHYHDFVVISVYQVTSCASSLTAPAYGHVTCTNDRELGSVCSYGCSTDYRLNGSTSRTCFESENIAYWNGSETNCLGK